MSSTMYTVVLQGANSREDEHLVQLRRAASASSAIPDTKVSGESNGNEQTVQSRSMSMSTAIGPQSGKATAPSLRGIVMEYFGPGQRLRDIYLASREGERFPLPITLAVQLSPLLREFVDSVMTETATRGGKFSASDKARLTIDVPCSTDALRTMVDFVTAKLELDLKLSEEGIRMTEEQKKEHWRDYIYFRVSWRMDLDDFADDIGQVADFLSIKSLYDLMKCCFRLRL